MSRSNRWVLLATELDVETENRVTRALAQDAGVEWWHRMSGVWLVVDKKRRTLEHWNSFVGELVTRTDLVLVFRLDAFGISSFLNKSSSDWLYEAFVGKPPQRGRFNDPSDEEPG
mgnify:CR=1 FL=1